MNQLLLLITCFIPLSLAQVFLGNQISPDCDSEWASMATGIIQSKITENDRLREIQAILESCNKAQMQKLTEVSVYLFEKGTFPNPQIMQELQQITKKMKEEKKKAMNSLKKQIPEHLHENLNEIIGVYMNQSLSGNEKVIWTSDILMHMDKDDRRQMESLLSSSPQMPQAKSSFPISIDKSMEFGPSPTIPSSEIGPSNLLHPPFPSMTDNTLSSSSHRLDSPLFSQFGRSPFLSHSLPSQGQGFVSEVQENTSNQSPPGALIDTPGGVNPLSRGDQLFASTNTKKESPSLNPLSLIPPTLYGENDFGRTIDAMTKNKRPDKLDGLELGAPPQPTVLFGGRPLSVGTVPRDDRENRNMEIVPVAVTIPTNIPDPDLLNPKPSLWNDAAKILQDSTRIPEKIGKFIEESVKNPDRIAEKIGESLKAQMERRSDSAPLVGGFNDDRRSFLPARRGDLPANSNPIVPINKQIGLERFETNVGRFDNSASANRFVLPQSAFTPPNIGNSPGAMGNFGNVPGGGMGQPAGAFGVPQSTVGAGGNFGLPGVSPGTMGGSSSDGFALPGAPGGGMGGGFTQPGLDPRLSQLFQQQQLPQQSQQSQQPSNPYTFPMPSQDGRGSKHLQNLPPWTPLPDMAAQFNNGQNGMNSNPFEPRMNGLKTYPDYRHGLFPRLENEKKEERPMAKTFISRNGNEFQKNINDQVEGRTMNIPPQDLSKYGGGGTVYLENLQNQGWKIDIPPRRTIGDDLSESDRRGGIPMGRYGKEGYDTQTIRPPIRYEATTVIAVPQSAYYPYGRREPPQTQWSSKMTETGDREPFPPPQPPFDRYFGPEHITGSHLTPNEYNVRHQGRNRFVKIDVSPTESVVG